MGKQFMLNRATARLKFLRDMERVAALSRPELDAEILTMLPNAIAYARHNSPLYRSTLGGLTNGGTAIKSLDHLRNLPFTTKDDLRARYPYGLLAVSPDRLMRYGESTGTTGNPTSAFMTYEDWERGNVWVERALRQVFTDRDTVFVAIPYELAFAAYDIDRALEAVGVTVVPTGTLNQVCPWERTVEMMRAIHPTGIVCTPTRALRLFDMFVSRGYDPSEVGLRVLFYTGETCSPSKLKKIADLWNVELFTAFGATETNSLALPCRHGTLHLSEDRYLFEVIDPETSVPLSPTERGELVLTSLASEAMPLVRYRTGDIVRIDDTPCACGLPHRSIQHFGRYSERILLQGGSVLRMDVEEAALSVPGTGSYYVLDDESDPPAIGVEVTRQADAQAVLTAVENSIAKACGIQFKALDIDKSLIAQAMDRMLKPGSLSIRHVREP
uniref:Phenylacetate-CoA ligase n=1 Tax=Candidatus Kentrum sp. MB TaxID=2138164 RepID=A0A451B9D5_9GAMM|nr:MAG: phenylacetate-CoA ligase [Candidatus Kentron sp. MB]VFK74847.1 MAG: phenylacetate-CoA ligase [Candidatus Kentron sp. MB]